MGRAFGSRWSLRRRSVPFRNRRSRPYRSIRLIASSTEKFGGRFRAFTASAMCRQGLSGGSGRGTGSFLCLLSEKLQVQFALSLEVHEELVNEVRSWWLRLWKHRLRAGLGYSSRRVRRQLGSQPTDGNVVGWRRGPAGLRCERALALASVEESLGDHGAGTAAGVGKDRPG